MKFSSPAPPASSAFTRAQRLLARGDEVVGLDNLNDYYDSTLKQARLAQLAAAAEVPLRASSTSPTATACDALFAREKFAARRPSRRAGRRALFARESARLRRQQRRRLRSTCSKAAGTTASSISSTRRRARSTAPTRSMPFSVHQQRRPSAVALRRDEEGERADGAHLQRICSACRRPACASSPSTARGAGRTWRCSCSRKASSPASRSTCSTTGNMRRDFTYVDDIVEGVVRALDRVAAARSRTGTATRPIRRTSNAPYRVYNIGNNQPVRAACATSRCSKQCLGRKAQKNLLPLQPGDVPDTCADIDDLVRDVGYRPGDAGRGRASSASSTGTASTTSAG